MLSESPPRTAIRFQVCALLVVVGVAVWQAPNGNWDLGLFGILLLFALISHFTAVETSSRLKISGSFLALVLAMAFLYGTPAALMGAITICASWVTRRIPFHYFLNNLLTFTTFPLIGGIAVRYFEKTAGIVPSDSAFYLLVFSVFVLSLTLNFAMIAGYSSYVEAESFWRKARTALLPFLSSEFAAALLAVGVAYLYVQVGIEGVVLFGVVVLTFQHLLGQLILSQERADELEVRSKQLVSFQVGVLGALMKTLDMRDKMTARHCASVARYARAIAKEAGMSKSDQELVHITGLMHDIGKFIFPDRILKADTKLTDDDWNLIRMHPQQGANVVASLEGYGPVAKLILAHHERIDGKGYPRGLEGDDIPELSRIISVADTYDVMTARDTYKEPVSSFEAIQELRRVSGTQLDGRFVDIFVTKVLEGKDITYRHGEDADFDLELALEERIAEVEGHDHFRVGKTGNGASSNGGAKDPKKRATA
jgi:putative nucleotidyltransferase with HDIG domain